jgi:hypothetical protein
MARSAVRSPGRPWSSGSAVTMDCTFGRALVLIWLHLAYHPRHGFRSVTNGTAMRTALRTVAPTLTDWRVQNSRRTTAHVARPGIWARPHTVLWTRRDRRPFTIRLPCLVPSVRVHRRSPGLLGLGAQLMSAASI